MERKRTSVYLDASTADLLDRVGNVSQYVNGAVEARWRAWQEALRLLQAEGWRRAEVLAVCDTLNGYWMTGALGRSGGAIAHEMADSESLNAICAKWDIPPPRWGELVARVASSATLADVLAVVSEEFWLGNRQMEMAIDRLK